MPAVNFSDRELRRLPPGDHWDAKVTGLGLRVRESGKRHWRLKVSLGNQQFKFVNLGSLDDLKTVDEARTKAQIEKGKVLQIAGVEPRKSTATDQLTLKQAWADYIKRCRDRGRSEATIDGYQRDRKHFEDWLDEPLDKLGRDRERVQARFEKIATPRDVKTETGRIRRVGGPGAANAALHTFSTVYNYALKRHPDLPPNPAVIIEYTPMKRRKMAYAPDELQGAFAAMRKLKPLKAGLHMAMLFTGCRLGGLSAAKREHFNRQAGTLHLENHKGRPFTIPLSLPLVSLFAAIEEIAEAQFPGTLYLFPAHGKDGHIVDPRADTIPLPAELLRHRKEMGFKSQSARAHHYRSTYITLAPAAGVPGEERRRLVDHKVASDANEGYVTSPAMMRFLQEQQTVMTTHILKLVGLPPDFRFTAKWFRENYEVRRFM